jgi:hypothetical protein
MSSVKRALSTAGMLCLGVLAALGIYVACGLVTFLLGGLFYSVTLGAIVAPVVAFAILAYRWTWRRTDTSWPMLGAMMVVQLVIAVLAVHDSPSTALMWLR